MRLLYQKDKYLKFSRKRARREEKRRIQRQRRKKHENRSSYRRAAPEAFDIAQKMGAKQFFIPAQFSFMEYPDKVIETIRELEALVEKRKPVFVNMEEVKEIDHAAISALLSIMYVFKSENVRFNGNFPRDEKANLIIRSSDFEYQLFANTGDKARYKIGENNQIITQAGKKLDPALVTTVIEDTSRTVWGEPRRSQGLNRIIIELIDNTHDHAAGLKKGTERWWLSINQDPENKKVSFVFLDYGVGVFTSLSKKPANSALGKRVRQLQQKWGLSASDQYLRSLMTEQIRHTSSDKKGRGNGIYFIGQTLARNQIGKLCVISNNAFGDVARGEYRKLDQDFNGTLFYWELGYNNVNSPWQTNP